MLNEKRTAPWAGTAGGEMGLLLRQIFNPDNVVFRTLGKAVDVVLLGLLWLVCSLPVVTIGPATAALYYSTVKCIRRGEDQPFGNFIRAFRQNFKVGAVVSVAAAMAAALLGWGYRLILVLANREGGTLVVMYTAYLVALLLPLGTLCYLFPVLSRFSFGPGGLMAASFKLAVRHLPSTVVLVLLLVEAVSLCRRYWFIYFLPLMLCPGVVALISSLFLERIFKKYTPDAPGPTSGEDEDGPPWYLK